MTQNQYQARQLTTVDSTVAFAIDSTSTESNLSASA